MRLVFGHDLKVAEWVAKQIKLHHYDPCTAIGIERKGTIIGGCIYNNFRTDTYGNPLSIEMSFATIDKRWATRGIIASLFAYPFSQLCLKRVQLTIAKRNKGVRRFVERLGFKLEGIARKAYCDGSDSAIYSMLRHECKWIGEPLGQINTFSASSSGPQRNFGGTNPIEPTNSAL